MGSFSQKETPASWQFALSVLVSTLPEPSDKPQGCRNISSNALLNLTLPNSKFLRTLLTQRTNRNSSLAVFSPWLNKANGKSLFTFFKEMAKHLLILMKHMAF